MKSGVHSIFSALPVLAVIMFLTNACSKEDLMTREELLTNDKWTMRSYNVIPGYDANGDGINDSDIAPFFEPCERDNYLQFYTNKTADFNEGNTKCDPRDQQSEIVSWSFNSDETRLTIDYADVAIEELTADRFSISFNRNMLGVNRKLVVNYRH